MPKTKKVVEVEVSDGEGSDRSEEEEESDDNRTEHSDDSDSEEEISLSKKQVRELVKQVKTERKEKVGENRWIAHVRATQLENSCTFSEAMKLASATYKKPGDESGGKKSVSDLKSEAYKIKIPKRRVKPVQPPVDKKVQSRSEKVKANTKPRPKAPKKK